MIANRLPGGCATFLVLLIATPLAGQARVGNNAQTWAAEPNTIIRSVENARPATRSSSLSLARIDHAAPIRINLTDCLILGVDRQKDQWWVLPLSETTQKITANTGIWILPRNAGAQAHSWFFELHGDQGVAQKTGSGFELEIRTDEVKVSRAEARPHSDAMNHRYSIKTTHGGEFEDALAGFYWGTMLPLVVEKTMASSFLYSEGYVLSTLVTSDYAGSYPAVDHEFQIAGRLAAGSEIDLDVVRRMIGLQFRLMNEDPERLSRAPTSVQPDGRREYHVRRNSKDDHQNAAMFPLTGNIEVVGESYGYFNATKDLSWLKANVLNLENAAGWTLSNIDQYGRVWSDVYYEDQVIKDGRETQAQAFAAQSFELLSRMETILNRNEQALRYSEVAKKIERALVQPLPMGFWDDKNARFVDWVDRDGKSHDHLHLLANTAPVTFGYATQEQRASVQKMVDAHGAEFERFPSFVAARIEDYTQAEMGVAGPYDLSAAGRYWYWDAAYREATRDNRTLDAQLVAVAEEGAKDNYFMGERYDMDHVYYIDGKPAHGASRYFEYPNVFAAVLIARFLGLVKPMDADVAVTPHLVDCGTVEFETPAYDLSYSYSQTGFVLKNLSGKRRSFKVDLSALPGAGSFGRVGGATSHHDLDAGANVTLDPQQEARWTAVR